MRRSQGPHSDHPLWPLLHHPAVSARNQRDSQILLGFATGNVAGNEKMSGVAGLEQFFEMFGDQDMWNLLHTKCERNFI